jgi:hypothetical protein
MSAETVLSFQREGSLSNSGDYNVRYPYPRDWQICIDVGRGFDLAETMTVTQASKRGLAMEWIAGCVEKYLHSVKGRR